MGSSKGKMEQVSTLTPEQQNILSGLTSSFNPQQLQQLLGGIGGFDITQQQPFQQGQNALSNLLQNFNPAQAQSFYQQQVADPARQQFSETVAPDLQERFIAGGASRSSSAQRQLAQAATNLESDLARGQGAYLNQAEQMQRQNQLAALSQALGYAGAPLNSMIAQENALLNPAQMALGTRAFENVYKPGQPSPFSGMVGAAGGAFGGGLGAGGLGWLSGMGFGQGINRYLGAE